MRLADALNGVKLCTQRLVFTVDKLDKRLGTVDTKMQQIKGATDRYLRAKDNISNVLAEIEKINEYFKVAKQVEPVVKAGLTGQPHEAFFGAVTRLHEAQRYFASRKKEIKAAGPALKAIDALLKKAVASCLDELERLLKAYGKSVEAVAGQFRVVTPDAEGLRIIDSVRGICGCLDATAHIEHLQTYQRLRAAQALGDLQAHETASMAAWEGLLQVRHWHPRPVHRRAATTYFEVFTSTCSTFLCPLPCLAATPRRTRRTKKARTRCKATRRLRTRRCAGNCSCGARCSSKQAPEPPVPAPVRARVPAAVAGPRGPAKRPCPSSPRWPTPW